MLWLSSAASCLPLDSLTLKVFAPHLAANQIGDLLQWLVGCSLLTACSYAVCKGLYIDYLHTPEIWIFCTSDELKGVFYEELMSRSSRNVFAVMVMRLFVDSGEVLSNFLAFSSCFILFSVFGAAVSEGEATS